MKPIDQMTLLELVQHRSEITAAMATTPMGPCRPRTNPNLLETEIVTSPAYTKLWADHHEIEKAIQTRKALGKFLTEQAETMLAEIPAWDGCHA